MAKASEDELAAVLDDARRSVKVGALYRHYKGNRYKVVDIAYATDSEAPSVVYAAQYGRGIMFVRPLKEWGEPGEIDGKTVMRFTRVG